MAQTAQFETMTHHASTETLFYTGGAFGLFGLFLRYLKLCKLLHELLLFFAVAERRQNVKENL